MQLRAQSVCIALGLLLSLVASAAQPAWVASLPGPPPTCSPKVVRGIQWGTATSAYQVEGGWNASGRTPSVWDTLAQTPGKIADNSTGDVAVDMYNRWDQDIALMKSLGIKNYRMSISWPRIVPGGVAGSPINHAGVTWYRNFITALLQAGIKPAVTLFHWDLPQVLQDKYQGFLDPRIQDDYLYYADTVFSALGDLVDQWMTFNEVISICELGYQMDVFAPAMNLTVWAKYKCGHNIILAHAKAVQLYRQKYKPTQNGKLSIALDGKWGYPKDPKNPEDVKAADYFMQFQYGWMADPIYFGDYPKIMRDTQDSLPKFTESEKALLKANVIDFLSVNFYTGYWVWAPEPGADKSQVFVVVVPFISPGIKTNAGWLFKTPDALRKTIVWLHKRYKGPEFWITESGVSGPDEESKGREHAVRDAFRLDYYNTYLDEMCKAITSDGANVMHYYAWSFLDNFEWRDGFSKRFGIVYVDLNDNLSRHPKSSAYWLSKHFFKPGPVPVLNTKQRQVAAKPAPHATSGSKAAISGNKAAASKSN